MQTLPRTRADDGEEGAEEGALGGVFRDVRKTDGDDEAAAEKESGARCDMRSHQNYRNKKINSL